MQLETTVDSLAVSSLGPDSFSSSGTSSYQGYNSSSHGYNTMSGASIVTDSTGAGDEDRTRHDSSDNSSGYLNDYADLDETSQQPTDETEQESVIAVSKPTFFRRRGSSRRYHRTTPSPSLDAPLDRETRWCHHRRKRIEEQIEAQNHVPEQHGVLPEVDRVPWSDQDILNALREGRASSFYLQQCLTAGLSNNMDSPLPPLSPPLDVVQKLGYLLQWPLVRIASEAERFSGRLHRCGRLEMQAACKITLSSFCFRNALHAGHKAATLYAMSSDSFRQSKSTRCGLQMSVGRFQRWFLDAAVAPFVHETAAIYAVAAIESLLDDIILQAFCRPHSGNVFFTRALS